MSAEKEIEQIDSLLWDALADLNDTEHNIEMHVSTLPEFTRRLADHLRKIKAVGEKRRDGVFQESETLHEQVLEFHKRFGQSIGDKPHVPDEKTVRFRLSLIAEEFFELLEAAHINPVLRDRDGSYLLDPNTAIAKDYVMRAIREDYVRDQHGDMVVDLPDFVDALADLDYVIEGARITFGVNGKPIADEVHRANMAKLPSYVAAKDASHRGEPLYEPTRPDVPVSIVDAVNAAATQAIKREDGKIGKPPGWVPPDIAEQLRLQGWKE